MFVKEIFWSELNSYLDLKVASVECLVVIIIVDNQYVAVGGVLKAEERQFVADKQAEW